jgi:hypothetical protein
MRLFKILNIFEKNLNGIPPKQRSELIRLQRTLRQEDSMRQYKDILRHLKKHQEKYGIDSENLKPYEGTYKKVELEMRREKRAIQQTSQGK